jgi:excisionase family DNA binding protein
MEALITYLQAACLLNMKLGTLYALVAQNRVPHVRLGRRLVRFSPGALQAWVAQRAVEPGARGGLDTLDAGYSHPRLSGRIG